MAKAPYKVTKGTVHTAVQQIADAVNQQTGANSVVRQVGIDDGNRTGVRLAGPDAIIIGADDARAMQRARRFLTSDRRVGEAVRAVRSVVGAVTDLAVASDDRPGRGRLPAERDQWDRPVDRAHLAVRGEHEKIQTAITQACAQAEFRDVVATVANRGGLSQQFADLVRTRGLPPDQPLGFAGSGFAASISPHVDGASDRKVLAKLNSRPPELKAHEAADLLLRRTLPAVTYDDPLAWRVSTAELARHIEADFAALDPATATAADGQRIGERAVGRAERIAERAAPLERPEAGVARTEQAPPISVLDGTASAADAPAGGQTGHGSAARTADRRVGERDIGRTPAT